MALIVRITSCFLCGIAAGFLVHYRYRGKPFFNFTGFAEPKTRDTDPNVFLRLLKNFGRNVKATGLYFLFGIFLSALFQRYVPADAFARLFGSNSGFGLLMAATIGVPLERPDAFSDLHLAWKNKEICAWRCKTTRHRPQDVSFMGKRHMNTWIKRQAFLSSQIDSHWSSMYNISKDESKRKMNA